MPLTEGSPRIVIHPDVRAVFPEPFNVLQSHLRNEVEFVIVQPDYYDDKSPKMLIPNVPHNTSLVVIPGFISGRHAEHMLVAMTKVGHTLGFHHMDDDRTPRATQIHYLLFDGEGRGNKPTYGSDGEYVPEAELHYAFYITDTLKLVGKAGSATILDPHDAESVAALGIPVTAITGLHLCAEYMLDYSLLPKNSGIIIADDGAIGRSLYFADQTKIPIIARCIKKRINGKPEIVHIYGKENIPGMYTIIVEDMIAKGGTLGTTAKMLFDNNAAGVSAVLTHVKGVEGAQENLINSLNGNKNKPPLLNDLIITNSTPYYHDFYGIPNVQIVNIHQLFVIAARAVLFPTQDNIKALQPHIFPLRPLLEYKHQLFEVFPDLAPDYTDDEDVVSSQYK